MRLIRVEWWKFKVELPVEVLYLLLRAFLMVHKLDRERSNTLWPDAVRSEFFSIVAPNR